MSVQALIELKGRMPAHFPSDLVALVEECVQGWLEKKQADLLLGEYIDACTSYIDGRLTMPLHAMKKSRSCEEVGVLACYLIWKGIPGPAALGKAMRRVRMGTERSQTLPFIVAAMPGVSPVALAWLAQNLGQRQQRLQFSV